MKHTFRIKTGNLSGCNLYFNSFLGRCPRLLQLKPFGLNQELQKTKRGIDTENVLKTRPTLMTGHVLGAAIKCGAQAIVTTNSRDFPSDVLNLYDIEAIDPDTFICLQLNLSQPKVLVAFRKSQCWLKISCEEFVCRLQKQNLEKTASRIHSLMGSE